MADKTPAENLIEISKIKFMRALVPIGIVVFALIWQLMYGVSNIRYLSLFALAYYIVIVIIFRINRSVIETEDKEITSPISGKIISVVHEDDACQIQIKKSPFNAADIRLSGGMEQPLNIDSYEKGANVKKLKQIDLRDNETDIDWQLTSRNIYFFPKTKRARGVLTGIMIGSGICYYRLPENIRSEVNAGDKVEAGLSIIGVKQ